MSFLPARRVTLEILALPLKHASSNFGSSWRILPRVMDLVWSADRHPRVDKVFIFAHKCIPFVVLSHGNRPGPKILDRFVSIIGLSLECAGQRVVSLLNLADDDRF